jgi:hypothetical protein
MATNDDHYCCRACNGDGQVAVRGPDGYSSSLGTYFARDVVEQCDDCGGTGVALCEACRSPDIEVEEIGAGGIWCTPCWLREWERRQAAERAQLNVALHDGPSADDLDLPF